MTGPTRSPSPARLLAICLWLASCTSSLPGAREAPSAAGEANRAAPWPGSAPASAPGLAELRAALRPNLAKHSRSLRRCHELAMAEDLRAGGRVGLALSVAPAGVVVDTRVTENESGNSLLARCLVEVTRHFVFPATDGLHVLPVTLRFARPALKLTVRLDDVPAHRTTEPGTSVKALLGPHNVTGDLLGLAVARLEKGSWLDLGRSGATVGVFVLEGAVRLDPGAPFPPPMELGLGEGATLGQAGAAARLVNRATGRSAVLLFLAPGRASRHWQGKDAPRPAARSGVALPILGRGSRDVVTQNHSLGPSILPTPCALAVAPGERALLNPTAADMHHALLVTQGVLELTLGGERLRAEVGMALYLPGKMAVEAVALRGLSARLIVMPWPGTGVWNARGVYPLVRFSAPGSPSLRHH